LKGNAMQINARELVLTELKKIRSDKGLPEVDFHLNEIILGENIGIDSLDLASLIITLEHITGLQPFQKGFVMFETIDELITLFSE
jgi:hypothetical protein